MLNLEELKPGDVVPRVELVIVEKVSDDKFKVRLQTFH